MRAAADGQDRVAVFTICSNNYMPFAHVLRESVRRHCPEADFFVCLADRMIDMPDLYAGDWTVIEAQSLPIPDFVNFAFRYDIMEFNTAVKPFMFQYLLEQQEYPTVLYFDPDIEIFGPIAAVITALRGGASFFLTPHMCAPCEESEEPNDITMMRAGIYNLGFLGISGTDEALRVLGWWARRLRYQCFNAQPEGIFVDQKFIDLVPAYARHVAISHDTTMNVAYWNLQQRRLELNAQGWTVDGAPLTFFHFSGFDPRKPARLSKHETRFASDMPEPLRRLTAHYAARLLERGYGTIPAAIYAYGRFASGTAIHPTVRKMFREWHQLWAEDPFQTYEAFLHETWPEASRGAINQTVTNYMKFLHGCAPHLASRLDLSRQEHVEQLVSWYVNNAANELHLDLPMIEPEAERLGALRRPQSAVPARQGAGEKDVTVVGYLRAASGVGEVGRQTLRTLVGSGYQVDGVDVAIGVVGQRGDSSCRTLLTETSNAPVQIFNINADQLPAVVANVTPRLRDDALRINIPFWELARFPDAWLGAFGLVHEIWAPSRFIQTSLAARTDRPVIHMPVAIELDPVCPLPRSRFGLPDDRLLFVFAFDFLSFMERKNPRATVRAFRQAFPRRGQAGLVLKCMNGEQAPAQRAALLGEIDGDPDIILLEETLSRAETLALIAACDAVLSLHRSEGLGLLMAEAMLLGKPVIATGYSASRELVTQETGYPVDFHLVPVGDGEYPFPSGQLWAEPDVAHAAWIMRRLHQAPGLAAPLVERALDHLRRNHSRGHVAALQKRRLQSLGMP